MDMLALLLEVLWIQMKGSDPRSSLMKDVAAK